MTTPLNECGVNPLRRHKIKFDKIVKNSPTAVSRKRSGVYIPLRNRMVLGFPRALLQTLLQLTFLLFIRRAGVPFCFFVRRYGLCEQVPLRNEPHGTLFVSFCLVFLLGHTMAHSRCRTVNNVGCCFLVHKNRRECNKGGQSTLAKDFCIISFCLVLHLCCYCESY